MNRYLNILLLIIIQFFYYFFYTYFDMGNTEKEPISSKTYLWLFLYIIFVSTNTYLIYHFFPMMKNYIKSKNILVEIAYFIVCLLLGAAITNTPTEFILVPLIIN
jgi:hypothetical protein